MSRWQIPTGWQWAKAIDISLIVGGGTPPTKNSANFTKKGIPWLTPADLSGYQDEYISRGKRDLSEEGYRDSGAQLMPKDAVLFTSRAPIGYCVLAANEISTNQGFKSLVLKGGINPKYIRYYLLASKQYAESLASGSTFKELSGNRIANLEIPIPPLNEQKRIVTRIEELQARSRRTREALETIPHLIDQLRQSILSSAFRGDLTKEWREKQTNIEPAKELLKRIRAERRKHWEEAELEKLRERGLSEEKFKEAFAKRRKQYKEPFPVVTSNLPELPAKWCWASLEEISQWITDGTHQPPPFMDRGIPFLVISNMVSGEIKWNTIQKWVSTETFHKYTGIYKPVLGDIIYSTVGSYGVAVEVTTNKEFMFQRHIAHIRPISKYLPVTYLTYALNSPICKEQADVVARGVAQKTVNLFDLRRFAIPLAPLSEQYKLNELLSICFEILDNQRHKLNISLDKLRNFEQSILTKAFRGELVPQDPNDEPASILLERIRQEKDHATVEPKVKDRRKDREMKHKQQEQRDIISVLRKSSQALTPEEVFSKAGFDEAAVDTFYDQLRQAIAAKQIREIRKGKTIRLEAIAS
ncbi:MAG: restriction endonuclease subunit S [Deltaproteobacteria bacterium]|nr:restriction endonuclease subunit S [Deltaproteobacteria bacterium]